MYLNLNPFIYIKANWFALKVLLTSRDRRNSDVQEIFKNTIGIAFLATPFRGSELIVHAMRAGNLLGFATPINKRILRVMKPYSEVLHRIQSDFQRMISSRTKSELPELHISCFYETLPLKFGLLVGTSRYQSL
jgi:hypothetical protein